MVAATRARLFACGECGHRTGKWMGFCAQCRAKGALEPILSRAELPTVIDLGSVSLMAAERVSTGLDELDRTLGGGLVPGVAIMVGGEPGVGKSTLLLQAAGAMVRRGLKALVVSAEESATQVALRASRLDGSYDAVDILATSDVDEVVDVAEHRKPSLLVVDSIQTISTRDADGMPGSITQVRECGSRLVSLAKRSDIPVVMIGHVTKDGSLAGPRLLEHLVDVVLYLEGDAHSGLRFVRGLKNRFGSTPALGFFEMGDGGMTELRDPATVLISGRNPEVPGKLLFPAIDGRRPVVVEVQALVAASASSHPRRSVKGVELARLHQILAVLERHAGVAVSSRDVYVAIVGGVRVREPAADLAVALAIASSYYETPLPALAAWGEVGLTGEVKGAAGDALRRAEAGRLRVDAIVAPNPALKTLSEALVAAGFGADIGVAAVLE